LVAAVAVYLIGALVLVGGTLIATAGTRLLGSAESIKVVPVVRPELSPRTELRRFHGFTRAKQQARLAFSVAGRLERRPVRVGQHVRAGQRLAQLDQRPLRNAVRAARASLQQASSQASQATRERRRAHQLVDANAAPARLLEQAVTASNTIDAAQRAARVNLDEALRALRETALHAPYDGTIAAVLYQPGEVIPAGHPVVVLTGSAQTEVQLDVPETVVSDLRPGQAVRVDLPLLKRAHLSAVVRSVGRAAQGSAMLFPVLVDLLPKNDPTASGLSAVVWLERPVRPRLTLPPGAISNRTGLTPSVLRVGKAKTIERVPIHVDRVVGERIAIVGPLTPSDLIVSSDRADLLPGDRVEPHQ
jgi:RND family efflux transporter MFP subunit